MCSFIFLVGSVFYTHCIFYTRPSIFHISCLTFNSFKEVTLQHERVFKGGLSLITARIDLSAPFLVFFVSVRPGLLLRWPEKT